MSSPREVEESAVANLSAILALVRKELRHVANNVYGYAEGRDDFPLLSEALDPALEKIAALLDAFAPRDALLALEAATTAWVEGRRHLDQNFVEEMKDMEADRHSESGFAALWTEALLAADLSFEERRA